MNTFVELLENEKYRNITYDAVQQVRIADEAFKNLPTEEAIRFLQDETRNTKRLINNIGEFIFVFEVFPTSSKKFPRNYKLLVHIEDGQYNKTLVDAKPFYETLKQKYSKVSDLIDIFEGIYNSNIKNPPIEPIGMNVHEYNWFNPNIPVPILKRSFSKIIEKDGRTFVIGSGFNIDPSVEEQILLKKQTQRTLLSIYATYLILWFIIVKVLNIESRFAILSTILVLTFITIQSTNVEGPGSEVDHYNNLRSSSIAIGAVTLGLAFIYFDQPRRIVKLLFIALVFVCIILLVNFRELKTNILTNLNTFIISFLAISVSSIITSAMIFISLKIKE